MHSLLQPHGEQVGGLAVSILDFERLRQGTLLGCVERKWVIYVSQQEFCAGLSQRSVEKVRWELAKVLEEFPYWSVVAAGGGFHGSCGVDVVDRERCESVI